MEFTAHNIALADGTFTIAAGNQPFDESGRCQAVVGAVASAFDGEDRSRVRVADLGALEGGYAVALARLGFDVLGIEGRATNMAKCAFVAQRCGLTNLCFVQDDVRNLDDHGPFDAVVCAGVLYHLDEPARFLEIVGACTSRLLVLDTHYATDQQPEGAALGAWTTNEGRRGRWYTEWAEHSPAETIEANLWASIGNSQSFWLDKPALLDAVRAAGFTVITEPAIDGPDAERQEHDIRTLLAARRAQ